MSLSAQSRVTHLFSSLPTGSRPTIPSTATFYLLNAYSSKMSMNKQEHNAQLGQYGCRPTHSSKLAFSEEHEL